jgi:hypothetical protein
MTMHAKEIYLNYAKYNMEPEKLSAENLEWKIMDKIGNS